MNYKKILSKAWNTVWNNRFLIVLGILASLGGWGSGSGGSQGMSDGSFKIGQFDFSSPFQNGLPIAAMIAIFFLFLVFLALWALGIISRGGLVYGADKTSKGQTSNFGESFQAGWKKGLHLIGIGLVPAIPVVLFIAIAITSAGIYSTNVQEIVGPDSSPTPNILILAPIIVFILLAFLVLSLLRTFAERACMLEDTGVVGSYRRGMQVLGSNLGSAIVLFLLQILISLGFGLFLFLPGIFIALCCFLWPLLIVVQGTFAAFYSTLWTLSWNEWTGNVLKTANHIQ